MLKNSFVYGYDHGQPFSREFEQTKMSDANDDDLCIPKSAMYKLVKELGSYPNFILISLKHFN